MKGGVPTRQNLLQGSETPVVHPLSHKDIYIYIYMSSLVNLLMISLQGSETPVVDTPCLRGIYIQQL